MSLYIRLVKRYDDGSDPSDIDGIGYDQFLPYISERARVGSPIDTDQQVYDKFTLDLAAQTEFQTLKTNYLAKTVGLNRLEYLIDLRNILALSEINDPNYSTPTQVKALCEAV